MNVDVLNFFLVVLVSVSLNSPFCLGVLKAFITCVIALDPFMVCILTLYLNKPHSEVFIC